MKYVLSFLFLLCCTGYATAQQADDNKALHVGLNPQAYWIDSQGGEVRTAAGGGAVLTITHYGNGLFLKGSAGWINLVGDPIKYQAAEIRANVGVTNGPFSGSAEISRFWYFSGREGGDTALGLSGQFHLDISDRSRILAGGRGGFLLSEFTTYYGSAFLGYEYKLGAGERTAK